MSLMTTGISDIFRQFLFSVVHGDTAFGKNVIEVQPAHAREFRRLAQAQRVLSVERHGQFQLEPRLRLGGRDMQRLVDVIRNVQRYAHGSCLHPVRQISKAACAGELRSAPVSAMLRRGQQHGNQLRRQ